MPGRVRSAQGGEVVPGESNLYLGRVLVPKEGIFN